MRDFGDKTRTGNTNTSDGRITLPLNPDQQQVVDAREGAYCVIAGPGAGKTETLKCRVKALMAEGIRASDILCLTFTREAAESMLNRTGGKKESFRTFHSLGFDILKKERGERPVEPEKRNRLLAALSKRWGLDFKELAQYISRMRHAGISPAEAMAETGEWKYGFPRAYNEYETKRLEEGWIDFDSMIADSLALLEDPAVAAKYQWRYVIADECQDTDSCQFRILQHITERHKNVMCIGDPAQSIYKFRGAEPENLLQFEKWFPNPRYIYLGQNYRSTPTIVDFVRENYPIQTPLKDKMVAARSDQGAPIEYKQFLNEDHEAEDALSVALQDPDGTAILARTNRQLLPLQTLALKHSIRYRLLGRSGFWQQAEIQKAVKKLAEVGDVAVTYALDSILPKMINYYRADDAAPEDNDRVDNLMALRKIAERRGGTARDFVAYANRCAQVKNRTGVAFGTIHSAKGLEFNTVIVIGTEAGIIPHKKGVMAEEKRIYFVAVSRAKNRLRLTWVFRPSPFVRLSQSETERLAKESCDYERVKKQATLFGAERT